MTPTKNSWTPFFSELRSSGGIFWKQNIQPQMLHFWPDRGPYSKRGPSNGSRSTRAQAPTLLLWHPNEASLWGIWWRSGPVWLMLTFDICKAKTFKTSFVWVKRKPKPSQGFMHHTPPSFTSTPLSTDPDPSLYLPNSSNISGSV